MVMPSSSSSLLGDYSDGESDFDVPRPARSDSSRKRKHQSSTFAELTSASSERRDRTLAHLREPNLWKIKTKVIFLIWVLPLWCSMFRKAFHVFGVGGCFN